MKQKIVVSMRNKNIMLCGGNVLIVKKSMKTRMTLIIVVGKFIMRKRDEYEEPFDPEQQEYDNDYDDVITEEEWETITKGKNHDNKPTKRNNHRKKIQPRKL